MSLAPAIGASALRGDVPVRSAYLPTSDCTENCHQRSARPARPSVRRIEARRRRAERRRRSLWRRTRVRKGPHRTSAPSRTRSRARQRPRLRSRRRAASRAGQPSACWVSWDPVLRKRPHCRSPTDRRRAARSGVAPASERTRASRRDPGDVARSRQSGCVGPGAHRPARRGRGRAAGFTSACNEPFALPVVVVAEIDALVTSVGP